MPNQSWQAMAAILLWLAIVPLVAQQERALTEAQVAAAIAAGRADGVVPYPLEQKSPPKVLGWLVTPTLRVALAAQAAAREHRSFGPADASAVLVEPLVEVVVWPYEKPWVTDPVQRLDPPETVLVMPRGSNAPADAIHPVWVRAVGSGVTVPGLTLPPGALVAAFPLSAIQVENTWILVFKEIRGKHVYMDQPSVDRWK